MVNSVVDLVALSHGNYCFLTDASVASPWVAMVDSNGDSLWIQGTSGQVMYSLDKTMDGGFVVAGFDGYSLEPLYLPYGMIAKLDSLGMEEWAACYGFPEIIWNQFNSVREISDGGYICAGYEATEGWLVRLEPETGIGPEPDQGGVSLFTPSPNPLSSSTLIRFSIEKPSEVTLRVFDLSGRMIEQLSSESWSAGEHQVTWTPEGIEPGCYLIVLNACGEQIVQRCVKLN